jgi:hypothetical protein
MHVGTTAKDVVVAATLGDMVIAATVVDTAVIIIEDIVMDLVVDTDPVMDMDIETVVTLGTILATEIQVTDTEAKRAGAIIVVAIEVVIIVMIVVVVAIVTHAQDTNLKTETITANTIDSSMNQGTKYVKREA